MNAGTREAVRQMIGSTGRGADPQRRAILLRAFKGEDRAEVLAMILAERRKWLNWLTVVQRQWQRETTNPKKARHHDSVSIRDKYVRLQGIG